MFVYLEPADNMNKRTFRAFVTGSYEPKLPKRFITHGQRPIYPDIDALAESRITPAQVVDMCYHEKELSIPDIDDMKIIISIIEIYLDSIKSLKIASPELRQYSVRCEAALVKLRESHHAWNEYLKNKDPARFGISGNIREFYRRLKGRETK